MRSQLHYTLVTGASSGIGRAIAEQLAVSRRLILHGRDVERLEETRLSCAFPESHLIWEQDLREAAQVAPGLVNLISRHSAAVVGFVHCAGLVHVQHARSDGLAVVLESLNVNYISAQQIIATLLRKRANPGCLSNVVVISSIWGQFGARGHSIYCASKAALDGMVRALAVELAPTVRVNSVLPGAVQTPMASVALGDPRIMEELQQSYPLGIGIPTDIASAVAFLMSDAARWITGQQFVVDGGRTVNMSNK
jgi:NAD(P)-dependent dehydrogenase (short-subunit alcohol dehydrogenase family)